MTLTNTHNLKEYLQREVKLILAEYKDDLLKDELSNLKYFITNELNLLTEEEYDIMFENLFEDEEEGVDPVEAEITFTMIDGTEIGHSTSNYDSIDGAKDAIQHTMNLFLQEGKTFLDLEEDLVINLNHVKMLL
ncbi:hypothetical protein [Geomicrobium sp. JCM 19055]|uniref:hypothetical protein n=1 Tax=Geomicrobium sp. JCM 19055 TaxID=1460649 RepID=UPI00045ED6EE|nr:hypothetical protein [Geomicrobium sp. JCM 19055]GAK00864.1 hypothetical protein JCM19055_3982 [Geomicrobium sp. JCM 19055]